LVITSEKICRLQHPTTQAIFSVKIVTYLHPFCNVCNPEK
jgi:hypothetical protein